MNKQISEVEAGKLLGKLKEAILMNDELAIEILYTRLVRGGYEVVEDEVLN